MPGQKSPKPTLKSPASLGELTAATKGEKTQRSVDLLGRIYEHFLTRFYTPSCVVCCLFQMVERHHALTRTTFARVHIHSAIWSNR